MPNKRRPHIIGPFFLIAILLSAGVFYWHKLQNAKEAVVAAPPVIYHQVTESTAPSTDEAPAPDPILILRHAQELGLTGERQKQLAKIVGTYGDEVQPLKLKLEAAGRQFAESRRKADPSHPVSMSDLEQQAATVSEYSRQKVAMKQRYWRQIAPLLTTDQQRKVLELWSEFLSSHTRSSQQRSKQQ
ncbi:MAG: hypothetical protein ABFE07_11020 [Armatimonadia bacterium]